MNVDNMLKEVLKEIKSEHEKIPEADAFLDNLNSQLKKSKIDAVAVPGGSYAKNTWLKGDYDIDLFVRFNVKYADDNLSDMLEKVLKPFKPERIHGSRDYFHVNNKIKYEIIPVINLKKSSDAHNVTDFSPLHVVWVNKKGKKLKDDIRLLKKFCKSQKVYGAESYIRGFSGHVVDIIIIYYGGFMNSLKAISKWKPKTIIDPEKAHKNPELVLNKSKIQGPLIIIDPIQPDRNSAAAITEEKYFQIIKSAKEFLKNPSKKFFEHKILDVEKLKQKGAIILELAPLEGKEDVVGTKLLKGFEYLMKVLEDFKPSGGWEWDKKNSAFFWFVPKIKKLSSKEIKEGPPVKMKVHFDRFKSKYRKTFIKNKRIYAEVERKSDTFQKALKTRLNEEYLKEKFKLKKVII